MSPALQLEAVKNPLLFLSNSVSPKLWELDAVYGPNAKLQWVTGQILEVAKDVKTVDGLVDLINRLAQKMMTLLHWHTVHEAILFFGEWSCGMYGKVFGSLNINDSLAALEEFRKHFFKRKQLAKELYWQALADAKKNSGVEIENRDWAAELQRYLDNAPADSIVANMLLTSGQPVNIPQRCKDAYTEVNAKISQFNERTKSRR